MELISVIVPIYKVEKYLEKCVNSIINQTYTNLEIILVDDGSPDNCGKMCDEFAKKDKRINVIHKANGGLSSARNAGIEKAKGQYIAFVDSDDYIEKNLYNNLLENLIKNNADISMCKVKTFVEDEEIKDESEFKEFIEISKEDAIILTNLNNDYGNYAWNKLYKRELFEKIRYPEGRVYEDVAVTCKLLYNAKKIVYTEYEGYFYLVGRQGSIVTDKRNVKSILDYLKSRIERYEFLKDKCPTIKDYSIGDYIRAVNTTNELVYGLQITELYEDKFLKENTEKAIKLLDEIDKNILFKVMNTYKIVTLLMMVYDEEIYKQNMPVFYQHRTGKNK